MRSRAVVMLLALLHAGAVPVAAQPEAAAADRAGIWRAFAQQVGAGSRIKLALRSGERISATLVQAAPDALLVQPRTRVPVAVQRVAYDDIVSIEKDDARGVSAGKAAAIGIGAGAGAFLGILLFMIAAFE